MYTEIPAVEGTPESRIAALQASRDLLIEEPAVAKGSMFGGESVTPGHVPGATALIRLATYIETGHDYRDTHPEGKRRPLIKNTHVTLVSPLGIPGQEDIEHLLHHVKNGDFAEFVEDMLKDAAEEPADKAPEAHPEEKPFEL